MSDYALPHLQLYEMDRNSLPHPESPTINCITFLLHPHSLMSDYPFLPLLHHQERLISPVPYCPSPSSTHTLMHAWQLHLNPSPIEPAQPGILLPPRPPPFPPPPPPTMMPGKSLPSIHRESITNYAYSLFHLSSLMGNYHFQSILLHLESQMSVTVSVAICQHHPRPAVKMMCCLLESSLAYTCTSGCHVHNIYNLNVFLFIGDHCIRQQSWP